MGEEDLLFSKARYEYCLLIFNKEDAKQEILEKKTQYYLSIITLIIGAIFIKMDFLPTFQENRILQEVFIIRIIMILSLIVLFFALLISLFSIFQSIKVRKFINYYPEEIFDKLFNPKEGFLESNNRIEFYDNSAKCFSVAIESKKSIIGKKAFWLQVTAVCFSMAIISLSIFLALLLFVNFI
jgi:hypothetical protein